MLTACSNFANCGSILGCTCLVILSNVYRLSVLGKVSSSCFMCGNVILSTICAGFRPRFKKLRQCTGTTEFGSAKIAFLTRAAV